MNEMNRDYYFGFCPPVTLENHNFQKKSALSKAAFKIGAWADRYASLSSEEIRIKDGCIDRIKIEGHAWKTALKVVSYVVTLFTLPILALIAKKLYKDYCVKHAEILPPIAEMPIIKKFEEKPMPVQKAQPVNPRITSYQVGHTTISLAEGDITETSEVIVNAANAALVAGAGVCGAFHQKAGNEIFDECEQIKKTLGLNSIPVGHAVLTTTGNIKQSKAVLHAVGPKGGDQNRQGLMSDVIENSLKMAAGIDLDERNISDKLPKNVKYRSIAFPPISTGIFGYPIKEAAEIAAKTIKNFVAKYPDAFDEINFVFLPLAVDKSKTIALYQETFNDSLK